MANLDTMVKLQASDDSTKVKEVSLKAIMMSETIKNMVDDLSADGLGMPIPLSNINLNMLEKIIEYCNYHIENDKPSSSTENHKESTNDIIPWDVKFCEVEQETLFELILAANYLNIKPLLDLTCKTVANMIKGKTPEEIRKTFNIKNDFTPEEEEKVRKDNEWCEER